MRYALFLSSLCVVSLFAGHDDAALRNNDQKRKVWREIEKCILMYQHWSWSQQVFQQGRIDNQVLSKEECDALLENNLNEGQAQEVNNRVRNKWLAVMRKEKKKEIIRNICNKRKQTPEEKQQINQVISEEFPQCDPSGLETDTLRIRGEQKLENDTKAVVHHSVDNPLSDHICQEAIKLSQEAPQLQQAVNREHVQQHLTQ